MNDNWKGKRLFTQEELDDFRKGFSELAIEAIEEGDLERAKELLRTEHKTHNMNHDLFIREIAHLYSIIYKEFGEEYCMDVIKKVSGFSAAKELVDLRRDDFRGWIKWRTDMDRQHSPHPDTIVEEDDEKIVLKVKCASGGMLIDDGSYDGEDSFGRFKKPTVDTWGETDMPLYCGHCHWVHEVLPILAGGQGNQFWVHETPFPKKPGDRCVHVVYKDPADIPAAYYERLGMTKEGP